MKIISKLAALLMLVAVGSAYSVEPILRTVINNTQYTITISKQQDVAKRATANLVVSIPICGNGTVVFSAKDDKNQPAPWTTSGTVKACYQEKDKTIIDADTKEKYLPDAENANVSVTVNSGLPYLIFSKQ